ncbi:MAG: hypothetical protein ACE5EQ_01960 [Phycisphaerae bacterium]
MDHGPRIDKGNNRTHKNEVAPVLADQAIFTSVRSPTGEGYRIVSASAGVKSEEKAEIIRRSPSHNSLCETEPDTVALMAFPLASGRYCVGRSCYAGREHTARGGQRVYTHLTLLDAEAYERFGCNPMNVGAAIDRVYKDEPDLDPPSRIDPLALTISNEFHTAESATTSKERRTRAELVLPISLAMLRGEDILVVGAGNRFDLLDATVISTPLAVRRIASLSCGLKFAPSRAVQLCFTARDKGESQRAIRGRCVFWYDIDAASCGPLSPYEQWMGLVKRRLEAGRESILEKLADSITEDASPDALNRIASICSDTDLVSMAAPSGLAELMAKYTEYIPTTAVETRLLQKFNECAKKRAAVLEALTSEQSETMQGIPKPTE